MLKFKLFSSNKWRAVCQVGCARKYSTFALNIQQRVIDLHNLTEHIWDETQNVDEVKQRFSRVKEGYGNLLTTWDVRMRTSQSTNDISPFQLQYYCMSVEFMLFLELYANFLESAANLRQRQDTELITDFATDQQLGLIKDSCVERNAVYKTFRLVNRWSAMSPDVKNMMENVQSRLSHVDNWSEKQKQFLLDHFPSARPTASPLEILQLNDSIYGTTLAAHMINKYQMNLIASKILNRVLQDMHYLPVTKYMNRDNRQTTQETNQGEEVYSSDSTYDTSPRYTERTDMLAVMAMTYLSICQKPEGNLSSALELATTADSIVNKYLDRECLPEKTKEHMMFWKKMTKLLLFDLEPIGNREN